MKLKLSKKKEKTSSPPKEINTKNKSKHLKKNFKDSLLRKER